MAFSVVVIQAETSIARAEQLAREAADIIRQAAPPPPAPGCASCVFVRQVGAPAA